MRRQAAPSPPARLAPRFAVAAALGILTVAGWISFLPKPVEEPIAQAALPSEIPKSDPQLFDVYIPSVTTEQFQALTARIDQPLERELENVLNDTRNAIRFVASNFLPEN
jgi:hypothetical protein